MSYATLVTDISNWTGRSDITTYIPLFTQFAESKFNERLRHSSMEASFTGTLANGEVALPTDFKGFKYLVNTTGTQMSLQSETLDYIKSQPTSAGTPKFYAIDNGNLVCYPPVGSVEGVYYQAIPSLQTSTTNWLDTYRHDLYVYEVLSHFYLWAKDQASALMYGAMADNILKEISAKDREEVKRGSTMVVRAR